MLEIWMDLHIEAYECLEELVLDLFTYDVDDIRCMEEQVIGEK